jgi:branched-chain amino acid transport system substrate-binding protein
MSGSCARRPRRGAGRIVRVVATWIAVCLVAAVASACAGGSSGGGDSGPVKVGIIWPFAGAYSNYGPDGLAGVQLALREAGMKVGNRPIELVRGNENVLDPSQTLAEAKRLVEQQDVKLLLGPVFGSSQQAIAPYLKQRKVMSFVPYGATRELGGTGDTVSWPCLDTAFSTPLGDFLKNTLHYSKIATLTADYVYGHNLIQGAVDSFAKQGGSVVQQQAVPLGTTDLLPYASNVDRNADALVMWLVPQDEASFIKSYQALKINKPLILVNGMFDPTFQSVGSQIIGTYGLVDWSAALDNPVNQKFVADFKAANGGQYPNNSNAAAYVDTKLALAAISGAGGSTRFDALRKSVTNVKMDTPYGAARVDANFFGVTGRTVVQAERSPDGRYVWNPVKTYADVPNDGS